MPLNKKWKEIKKAMEKEYGTKKWEKIFYASENKWTIKDVTKTTKKTPKTPKPTDQYWKPIKHLKPKSK